MGGSFPGIVAAFLILSAVVLYLMRKVMALPASTVGRGCLRTRSSRHTSVSRVVEIDSGNSGHRRNGVPGPLPVAEVETWAVRSKA